MRRLLLTSILVFTVGAVWPGAAALAAPTALGDFNGDGHGDLAVGIPEETVGTVDGAGAVSVLYGTPLGLEAGGNQLWHQDSAGVVDAAEQLDRFGSAVAAGDFNGDRRADLAVAASGEDVGTGFGAGAVNVLYGSPSGLIAAGNDLWHQNSPGIAETAEELDFFGEALAAGDFNGNGRDDLAVGVGGENVGTISNAGAVSVLYGSASGLAAAGSQLWHQNSAGIAGTAEDTDALGSALAAGDFNGNGRDDLAVGATFDKVGSAFSAGAVNVLYGGSGSGLSATGNQLWHQNSAGVLDAAEDFDEFGSALAADDLSGDGRADLAVGAPAEDVGTIQSAGAVNVLYGSAAGVSASGNQLWHQNNANSLDTAAAGDRFGQALTAADFNGNGRADLASGATGEEVGFADSAGAVTVLYGTGSALSSNGSQFWHQGSPGILDEAESFDDFGFALAAGDFNGNGRADLLVGVPFEDVGAIENAGAVNVIYGNTPALSASGNQFWNQNSAGILDTAETLDNFGNAVAAGGKTPSP